MTNKNTIKYLYFPYKDFTNENFSKEIMKNFLLNTTYSIIIKLSSNSNTIFKMAGTQIGLYTGDSHNETYYKDLFEVLNERIEIVYDTYNYIDNIETILIQYSVIQPQEELKIKNVNSYFFNKILVNNKEVKKDFNQNLLPLSFNLNTFGIKVLEEEKSEILETIKNKNPNLKFLDNINNIDIFNFTNKFNQKKIIISETLDQFNFNRYIFDFKTNICIKIY